VSSFATGSALVLWFLRNAFFVLAVVMAIVCLIDWLVRTRRVSPFGGTARFFRSNVDPLFVPVERQVIRAGGSPTSAPWWALVAVVLIAIVVLNLLEVLLGQVARLEGALASGPIGILRLLIRWTFALLQIALIIRVVSSWIRISPYSPWIRWTFTLTEPILGPLRRIVPTLGMIDITPIIAYFLLSIIEGAILTFVR
jgi:YggT family protein